MEMEIEMELAMEMEMVMVIFGARKASSEFRFASKWFLTSDFEALEASGVPKGDQESPESSQEAPRSSRGVFKRLPRGSLEVLWEFLEVQKAPQATILDTFIVSKASKRPPGGPQVTIYRPCRRFRVSRRGTGALVLRVSRARPAPRTRSRTRFLHLYYWKAYSKRRCSLLTGGSAD